eukprot:scaffold74451_cov58-Phaeocystis_antarctica.AAC.1
MEKPKSMSLASPASSMSTWLGLGLGLGLGLRLGLGFGLGLGLGLGLESRKGYVLELDVSVRDAAVMQVGQRAHELAQQPTRERLGQPLLPEVHALGALEDLEEAHNVLVPHLHADLVLEAPPRARVGEPPLVEGLDRDELQRQPLLRDAHEAVRALPDGLADDVELREADGRHRGRPPRARDARLPAAASAPAAAPPSPRGPSPPPRRPWSGRMLGRMCLRRSAPLSSCRRPPSHRRPPPRRRAWRGSMRPRRPQAHPP